MKKLIMFIALITVVILAACDKDPLGIEDNIIITKLTEDEPIPEVKTEFESDTVICEFIEKIKLINSNDTLSLRWSPLLIDASAVIDTLGGLTLINFVINTQRYTDSLAEYRKEHILGFHLNLDSFDIVEQYTAEQNNPNYKSQLSLQLLPSKKVENVFGNYPFIITFRNPVYDDGRLVIRGRFQIIVPTYQQTKKYDYIFIGEFNMHFTLE
ncbi:MAG: hypothetical protein V1779_09590 [bacterium]